MPYHDPGRSLFPLYPVISNDALITFAAAVRQDARARRWRRGIALCGSPHWSRRCAAEIHAGLKPRTFLWLGTPHQGLGEPFPAAFRQLGRDLELLVYDAHAGFDPDAFAAALGSLVGGGLLLLLAPPWAAWPQASDPQMERITVHPFATRALSNRFVHRLAGILSHHGGLVTLNEHDAALPRWPDDGAPAADPGEHPRAPCRTADQADAVAAVVRTAREQPGRPLVVTADRGRGKSAALGIAAAELLRDGRLRMLVTGPRRSAVDAVFDHAGRLLPDAQCTRSALRVRGGVLGFMAPDALLEQLPPADLVLVDEAAAIPAALLKRLLAAYERIVFSTTIHGYEGSGRGFALRFRDELDSRTPHWRALHLNTPIRWAPGDPLEDLLFQALLLDAEPVPASGDEPDRGVDYEILRLDRDALVNDEPLLRQLFGLLIAAHYRTTPLDLRHLLDGPNLQLWIAQRGGVVLGALLAAEEGGFDAALAHEVWAGRRRPRGHLLPESLSAHLGLERATRMRGLRVIRIAVQAGLRRRGIGSALIQRLIAEAEGGGVDFVGAAFAASEPVLLFWRSLGIWPVRIGNRRETTSGAHSVLVMQGLGDAGRALAGEARRRFLLDLPWQRDDALRDMTAGLAELLAQHEGPEPAADARIDRRLVEGFAFEQRPFEATGAALLRMMGRHEARMAAELDGRLQDALRLRVARHLSWSEAAQALGISGRAQLITLLRRAAAALLRLSHNESRRDGNSERSDSSRV